MDNRLEMSSLPNTTAQVRKARPGILNNIHTFSSFFVTFKVALLH